MDYVLITAAKAKKPRKPKKLSNPDNSNTGKSRKKKQDKPEDKITIFMGPRGGKFYYRENKKGETVKSWHIPKRFRHVTPIPVTKEQEDRLAEMSDAERKEVIRKVNIENVGNNMSGERANHTADEILGAGEEQRDDIYGRSDDIVGGDLDFGGGGGRRENALDRMDPDKRKALLDDVEDYLSRRRPERGRYNLRDNLRDVPDRVARVREGGWKAVGKLALGLVRDVALTALVVGAAVFNVPEYSSHDKLRSYIDGPRDEDNGYGAERERNRRADEADREARRKAMQRQLQMRQQRQRDLERERNRQIRERNNAGSGNNRNQNDDDDF